MRRLLLVLLALFGVAASPPARAGDQEQVPLTPALVENFLAGHGALRTLALDLRQRYGDRSDAEGDDPVASLPAYQDIAEAKARTAAELGRYGFTDFDAFQLVMTSVLLAYEYVDPATAPPDADAEKAKTKAEIEADKSLTPDKRAEALQQLEQQYAGLVQYIPLAGNVDAVRPYAERIRPIAEAN